MAGDAEMRDPAAVEEEHMMYGHGAMTEQELDEKYPIRPHNHSKTLPFRVLFQDLFNPLNDNKKKPTGPAVARRKQGPHVPSHAPNEIRRNIIDRFISKWRKEVGNDIYPAFRLIVPEKDRDRGMYGLKEMTLGKLLVKIMQIDKNSEDGYSLLHWKLPGVKSSSAMAGDFAGRCLEVLSKRPMRQTPGDMTIAEVNEQLDRLSVAQKEENQRPIISDFYNRMNAEELMWLIRTILRQMKVGATEKTFFEAWHPDAENLFNISSSLRRVCWELYDPQIRLEGDNRGIALMQCFQPQLAAFQMRSMEQMVAKMNPTEEDPVFWIEEKLDGERMQMHMIEDDERPGGKRFGFWSRKAKDYTYLYGNGFQDDNAALTRHIRDAFDEGVRNIILDGEMITWDPKEDAIVGFGTLKTAALEQQANPYAGGNRPLFRVFDCLYLNDKDLTRYTLRDRRRALEKSVRNVHRRMEIHKYVEAVQPSEIEPELRRVVAEASEGLVLKNPRSEYRLNDRNDDWIKVKPEYMTEFGESLDCVVIGAYYGSGKRGGGHSSFLCGLKPLSIPVPIRRPSQISQNSQAQTDPNPQYMLSFFKVGGGFSASDYAEIRHRTEGKWIDWNSKKPPHEWIALGGGDRQFEKPDQWIKPEDSVVISVKAASAGHTDQFATKITLRFPRFKKLRTDKDWTQALTFDEFLALKSKAETEHEEKKFKIDEFRKNKRSTRKRKRELVIQGQEGEVKTPYAGPATQVFEGLQFFIMTEAPKPIKKSKAELEELVKANGGKVVASDKDPETILVADRNVVKVASAKKRDDRNIIRPDWLLDCIKQNELDVGRPTLLLPLEPYHLFHTIAADEGKFDDNVDEYGDSYTRDVSSEELLEVFKRMPAKIEDGFEPSEVLDQFIEHGQELDALPGFMFRGLTFYVEQGVESRRLLEFAGGVVSESLESSEITHVVVAKGSAGIAGIRRAVSSRHQLPRIVTQDWVTDSWAEKTRLDEERYAP
ncbi:DNA ligase 4 [Lecanosticta acicola]|uniref:DNA ligase n=1 Tax=Lecanosticta acicola TaxID=111012 RepID=A0AAI9E848_9PEZI|nr:DNA ligase 4 [Lecanosticta acicola]